MLELLDFRNLSNVGYAGQMWVNPSLSRMSCELYRTNLYRTNLNRPQTKILSPSHSFSCRPAHITCPALSSLPQSD